MLRIRTAFPLLTIAAATAGTLLAQEEGARLEQGRIFSASVEMHGATALQQAAALVDTFVANGDLRLTASRADRYRADRQHDSFRQYYRGVPVRGGGITRQRDTVGPVSVFGTIHDEIDVDVVPQILAADAVAILESLAEATPVPDRPPELQVVPSLVGGYALAWLITMDDYHEYALNAHTGAVEHREPLVHQEGDVGGGYGIVGVRKKVSARRANGSFEAYDELRPAEIVTLDVNFNERRLDQLIDGSRWSGDVASDDDNDWNDAAVVDAHVYTGFMYDYLLSRHGWRGVDGQNGRILSIVNMDLANAFFVRPPFGPEGRGVFGYGIEDRGTPITSADIVGHELMHGVTHYSVFGRTGEPLHGHWYLRGPSEFTLNGRRIECDDNLRYRDGPFAWRWFRFACLDNRFLLWSDQGSAVNEAYSDIFGTAVEFAVHEPGMEPLRPDYLISEDTGTAIRSLEDPRALYLGDGPHRYPDAYEDLVRFLLAVFLDGSGSFYSNIGSVDGGRTMTVLPGWDYGGEHWNSTVLSHAFYLAVEGGRNRTTGRRVRGVGTENRAQVERVFFRAMTDLMPALAGMRVAAEVIRQSAIDLEGRGSALYGAIDEALSAVGLER
ncbi:MAG: M4 family metallopeptidase [Acidobacteria bacterium]|nr:M4 family metallopeptidase [Acidobacteriota bacterium]